MLQSRLIPDQRTQKLDRTTPSVTGLVTENGHSVYFTRNIMDTRLRFRSKGKGNKHV